MVDILGFPPFFAKVIEGGLPFVCWYPTKRYRGTGQAGEIPSPII